MEYKFNEKQILILKQVNNGIKYIIREIIDDLVNNDYYSSKAIIEKENDLIIYVNNNLKKFKIIKEINRGEVTRTLNKLFPEYKNRLKSKKRRSNKKYDLIENKNYGVYGIYVKDKLVYIGRTYRNFEERFEEHKNAIEDYNLGIIDDSDMKLYEILSEYNEEDIIFKKIINVNELKTKEYITIRDISMMELALIHLYKPIGNIQGITSNYEMKYN